jgi:hypothetical protein
VYAFGRKIVISSDCDDLTLHLFSWYIIEYCIPCYETHRTRGTYFHYVCAGKVDRTKSKESPITVVDEKDDSVIDPSDEEVIVEEEGNDSYVDSGTPEPLDTGITSSDVRQVWVYNPNLSPTLPPTDISGATWRDPVPQGVLTFTSPEEYAAWKQTVEASGYNVNVTTIPGQNVSGNMPNLYIPGEQLPQQPTTWSRDTGGDPYAKYTVKVTEKTDAQRAQEAEEWANMLGL